LRQACSSIFGADSSAGRIGKPSGKIYLAEHFANLIVIRMNAMINQWYETTEESSLQ
jgi:hypothetical protein